MAGSPGVKNLWLSPVIPSGQNHLQAPRVPPQSLITNRPLRLARNHPVLPGIIENATRLDHGPNISHRL